MAKLFSWLKRDSNRYSDISCYVSYARRDGHAYAKALVDRLKDFGISFFFDEESLAAGVAWAEAIQNYLRRADVLIVVGTPMALKSEFMRNEIEFCLHDHKPILPILFGGLSTIDDTPFFLRDISWLREDARAINSGPSQETIHGLLEALDYFRETRSTKTRARVRPLQPVEKRPLNEGKLILVGRGEVGKTSPVRRLANNDFRRDESKTNGINITTWQLSFGSESLRLNVWDFGGQEIMHATHQFFLTERSLYLVVLNGREGGEDPLSAESLCVYVARHFLDRFLHLFRG